MNAQYFDATGLAYLPGIVPGRGHLVQNGRLLPVRAHYIPTGRSEEDVAPSDFANEPLPSASFVDNSDPAYGAGPDEEMLAPDAPLVVPPSAPVARQNAEHKPEPVRRAIPGDAPLSVPGWDDGR